MATLQQQQQMPAATLDKDYDYYGGGSNGASNNSSMPRVKKGLGAMPMPSDVVNSPQEQQQPRAVSPPQEQREHGMDPPGDSEEGPPAVTTQGTEGDEALLDLEQLQELHHEAERMKALGNKHMAAQVSY